MFFSPCMSLSNAEMDIKLFTSPEVHPTQNKMKFLREVIIFFQSLLESSCNFFSSYALLKTTVSCVVHVYTINTLYELFVMLSV